MTDAPIEPADMVAPGTQRTVAEIERTARLAEAPIAEGMLYGAALIAAVALVGAVCAWGML